MKKIFILIAYIYSIELKAQNILLQESFNNGALPPGWTIDSAGVSPVNGWTFSGSPLVISGNGFDSNYARIDVAQNIDYDCNLTSPTINASLFSNVFMAYSDENGAYIHPFNFCYPKVEVSNNGGSTWSSVLIDSIYNYPNKRTIIDISNIAAGYSNVKFRFHFYARNTGEWAVDSIIVADSIHCISPPDSGITKATSAYSCTGNAANVFIDGLSRGIGQTYQWQLNNAASGNVYTDIPGAVYDTLTILQNGPTYYRCTVTCSGLSTTSQPLYLTDVPTGINPYSDNIHICSGRDDTLRLYPPYGGPGIGYQWTQSALYNGAYSDIPGATNDTYIVGVANYNNMPYYKCKQICQSNGTSASGVWVNEVINPNPLCYCYPWSNNPCINNYYISSVSIAGTPLNHTATCIDTLIVHLNNNNYQFFDPAQSNQTALLQRGVTYTLQTTTANQAQYMAFWIDYDGNTEFDSTEFTDMGFVQTTGPGQTQFTVPINATPGITGLRLRSKFWPYIYSTSACATITGGNTYDYLVTIDTTVSVLNAEEQSLNFELFPNPATKELTVSSGSMQGGSLHIQNMLGETVYTHHSPFTTHQTKLNISFLPPGIYFVKLNTERGMAVRKFVKQ